ncbi:MAG: methyl-accepting chemotaxis protein [Phycisphaerales bacterium]
MRQFSFRTLRGKLFGGFGALVFVAVVSGLVVIQRARTVDARAHFVLDDVTPARLAVSNLRGEIHHALSMHRGYMILGLPVLGEERLKAWTKIDASMEELRRISDDWPQEQVDTIKQMEAVLADFRVAQDRIAEVSHTADDHPAKKLYFDEAMPLTTEIVHHLEDILDAEDDLPATPERKLLVKRIAMAKTHLLQASSTVSEFLITGDEKLLVRIDEILMTCGESVDRLVADADILTEEQAVDFEAYLAKRARFLDKASRTIEMRSQPDWCVSEDICLNSVAPLSNEAIALADSVVEGLIAQHGNNGNEAEAELQAAITSLPWIAVAAALLSAAIGVFVGTFITRGIVSSVREVGARAASIANGNLSGEPIVAEAEDEIGELVGSINRMQDSLRSVIGDVEQASAKVADASERIRESTEDVLSGVAAQGACVERIAASADRMDESVQSVVGTSMTAAETAESSAESARTGGDINGEVIAQMQDISRSVQDGAKRVAELGERSAQISNVVSVINDIADQTNLLALNATIEAARAGEHGRGFAVVASEVRDLAERTQQATEEIRGTISAIQTETNEVVERIQSGTSTVERGLSLAEQSDERLKGIVDIAGQVREEVLSIQGSTDFQTEASQEIRGGVQEISEVVKVSTERSEVSMNLATELADRAGHLRKTVEQFQL